MGFWVAGGTVFIHSFIHSFIGKKSVYYQIYAVQTHEIEERSVHFVNMKDTVFGKGLPRGMQFFLKKKGWELLL